MAMEENCLAPTRRCPSMTSEGCALTDGHNPTASKALAMDGEAQRRPSPLQIIR
jgi:hypothetical protein